jgi:hypothetical protein
VGGAAAALAAGVPRWRAAPATQTVCPTRSEGTKSLATAEPGPGEISVSVNSFALVIGGSFLVGAIYSCMVHTIYNTIKERSG